MARLTARFDMQDRITRRLKRLRNEVERLERQRARLNKPLTLTVRDRATRALRSVGRYISNDIARTHRISLAVRDRASKSLRGINNFMRNRFPKSHELLVRAKDRAMPYLQRLNNFMRGNILGARMLLISAKDRATPTLQRIRYYTRNTLGRGYSFTINAIDRVSKTAGRIGNYINNNIPRMVNTTVRVVDLATKPLRAIAGVATSTLGMLGVAGGVAGGIMIPIRMVSEREDITTAFETMLGSREEAQRRLDELTDFAGRTPLIRDEIFRASRILQTFTGEALSTADGMEIIGDVAVGTQTSLEETATWFGRLYDGMASGRPIGMATNRLQEMGAISGEARARIEELAESGKDISELWPEVTKEFEQYNGMMEKMSHNMSNLLLGLKSFVQNAILIPWGDGLSDALKPALQAFREWRNEYSFVLDDMSRHLRGWGEGFADSILNPTSKVFKFIGDQMKILFPSRSLEELREQLDEKEFKEFELRLKEDLAFKRRFDELEKYRDMSFEVRWELVKSNVGDGISEWWNTTGRSKAESVGQNIGRTYGGFISSALLAILGGDADETGNPFIDGGISAGKNFVSGFIEALDPVRLGKAITNAIVDANVGAVKSIWGKVIGDEELESQGSIMGAVLANAFVLAFGTKVVRLLRPIGSLIMGAGGLFGRFFGGGKKPPKSGGGWFGGGGGKPPKPPRTGGGGRGGGGGFPPFFPSGSNKPPNTPPNTPPVYTHPWFDKGKKTDLNVPNQKGLTKNLPKVSKFFSGIGSFAKRIPVLGTGIGLMSILGSDDKAKATGSVAGGAGGAMAGASIGSVVPVIGTALGGIIGGILGSMGGGEVVDWFRDNFDGLKRTTKDITSSISDSWSSLWGSISGVWSSFSTWFTISVWLPISNFASETVDSVTTFFFEGLDLLREGWGSLSGWFIESVWTPVSNFAINTVNFIVGAFVQGLEMLYIGWGMLSDWFLESVWSPIQLGFETLVELIVIGFTVTKDFIVETWGLFSEWFVDSVWSPIKEFGVESVEWISEKWNEGKEFIQEHWSEFTEWFDEFIWQPVKEFGSEAISWISERWNEGKDFIVEHWEVFAGWFDETVWQPVKEFGTDAGDSIKDTWLEAKSSITEAWGALSGWFSENVFDPIKEVGGSAADYISSKFSTAKENIEEAYSWAKGKWDDAKGWASDIIEKGRNVTGLSPDKNATGGYITKPTLSWIGEAGNEFVIPTENNRGRGRMLLDQASRALGMRVVDDDYTNSPTFESPRMLGFRAVEDDRMSRPRFESPKILGFRDVEDDRMSNLAFESPQTLDNETMNVIHHIGGSGGSKEGKGTNVNVYFTGDNHYSDDFDAKKHGQMIIEVIDDHLGDGLDTGSKGVHDDL